MKNLMGDFNGKVGREEVFKPIIGNESLHRAHNDNGFRLVYLSTSKSSATFLHRDIHKHTWTSLDGVTHNQIDLL
jgi:hypothetical protein